MSGFEWLQPGSERRRLLAQRQSHRSDQAKVESSAVRGAVAESAHALLSMQKAEGYWCGDLTADVSLPTDYVLLQLWLHPPTGTEWNPPASARARLLRAAQVILSRQLSDGGWNIYPDGPAEVNVTVRAYVALKLLGHDPESPYMVRARNRAIALGGLLACNSYTKINLSLFNLYPRNRVPSVPPEIVLLPRNVLYEMSSWTRTIVVPLSIVQACGKSRHAPDGFNIEELIVPLESRRLPKRDWLGAGFHHMDRLLKLWDRRGPRFVRTAALREAERWVLERTRYTEGLGAIFPAMMYFIMALDALGYAKDHPDLTDAIHQLDALLIETTDRFEFQPCVSPLWDTAYACFVLGEAGLLSGDEMVRAADWLLEREVRRKGDWAVKRPELEPSGWAFEFQNEFYPDIDDTAQVLLAFKHAQGSDADRQERCVKRAINWLLGMQSSDGGWAAFDVDNNWEILNKVPFADHNAMLDPTCPDITGRVLEALCTHGLAGDRTAIQRGVQYLLRTQEANGSWYGRWGVNYIYGTFLSLRGLAATGDPAAKPAMERAAKWLRSVQNRDGGWGESCSSYDVDHFVPERSTPSQTAWALLGLAATGDTGSHAMQRGIKWLLDHQEADGTWKEELATGTGFPRVFYLCYHLYRHYFPILALATCGTHLRAHTVVQESTAPAMAQ